MKSALVLVLGLVACSYSKPQGFLEALGDVIGGAARDGARTLGDGNLINNIRNRIRNNPVLQERILQNRLNPCKGEAPQACRCTDGQSFQFSIEYDSNPCTGSNSTPDSCFCPDGSSFKPEEVAQDAADQFGIPTCGRDQRPDSCSCQDGSVFRLTDLSGGRPCGGGLPSSCTCPDGRVITANQVISRVIPAIQELLG